MLLWTLRGALTILITHLLTFLIFLLLAAAPGLGDLFCGLIWSRPIFFCFFFFMRLPVCIFWRLLLQNNNKVEKWLLSLLMISVLYLQSAGRCTLRRHDIVHCPGDSGWLAAVWPHRWLRLRCSCLYTYTSSSPVYNHSLYVRDTEIRDWNRSNCWCVVLTGAVMVQVACSWQPPLSPEAQGSMGWQVNPSPVWPLGQVQLTFSPFGEHLAPLAQPPFQNWHTSTTAETEKAAPDITSHYVSVRAVLFHNMFYPAFVTFSPSICDLLQFYCCTLMSDLK